ncbi:GAF and ANTAR domain-containing protein [Flexivirga caeni]|uniref:ANTAR domain-containing protein n=1 Tax=Flexivirga caeni TaxID=2294115 RepID=A0A3M9MCL5_9MICO|nr:GAF and ANTAR domain-containing protein [Flexivirga caeni]RNI22897.1 ANTAR domain-containing protein [Flexivirga caeni]
MDAREFAQLAAQFDAAETPAATADEVVEQGRLLLGADHAGISLIETRHRLRTVGTDDPVVLKADGLQYSLEEGPCYYGAWNSDTLSSDRIDADERWPSWGREAAKLGLVSALAGELSGMDGRRLGCLNLYWQSPREFSRDDRSYVQIFTTHAAIALASSLRDAQLNIALDARKVIGQAQGILMERHALRAEQAFDVLRRYSQDHNIKLREVAEFLVSHRELPTSRAEYEARLPETTAAEG